MSPLHTRVHAALFVAAMMLVAGVGCESAEFTVPIGERIDENLSDWSGAWHHEDDVVFLHGGADGVLQVAMVVRDGEEDRFALKQFAGFVTAQQGKRYFHMELPEIEDIDQTRYACFRIDEVRPDRITVAGPNAKQFIAAVREEELPGRILEGNEQDNGHRVTRAIISDKAALDRFIIESDRQLFDKEPTHLYRVEAVRQNEDDEERAEVAFLADRLRELHAEPDAQDAGARHARRLEIKAMTGAELRWELLRITRLRRDRRGTEEEESLREDFELIVEQLRGKKNPHHSSS